MVVGIAKPYGFVIIGPARTGQPRTGDPEGEGRAAFPSSGDTLLPAASCPSNLLGDGVSSVQESLRQVPFRRRRVHPIFLEMVLLLGETLTKDWNDRVHAFLIAVTEVNSKKCASYWQRGGKHSDIEVQKGTGECTHKQPVPC